MAGTVFATTLQTLRKKRGVTQEQLAAYLGVSPQAVSKWENGSFPDGDLLPRIADYFEVSIDYLYGRDTERVSVEQMVMDSIKVIPIGENHSFGERFEKILRYVWAAQASFWMENKTYYDRAVPEENNVLASTITNGAGFTYFRLNRDLEYYMLMKRPAEGFSSYFQVTDRLAEFFAFLGKKENLQVLFYLLSLNDKECVSGSTISKKIGISEAAAKEALTYLSGINAGKGNGPILREICLLDEFDKREKIYAVNQQTAATLLILFAGADGLLSPPDGYALSIADGSIPWMERENLKFVRRHLAQSTDGEEK